MSGLGSQSRFDQGFTARVGPNPDSASDRACLGVPLPTTMQRTTNVPQIISLPRDTVRTSASLLSLQFSDSCIPDGVGRSPPRHTRCSQSEKISLAFCEPRIFTTPQFSLLDYQDNKAYQVAAIEQQNQLHASLNELNRSLLTGREELHTDVEELSSQVDGLREDLNRLFVGSVHGTQRSSEPTLIVLVLMSEMHPSHHTTTNPRS